MDKEAKKLIEELKTFNLTEEDIASKLSMSYSAVYSWIKGRRNPSHLVIEKLKQILRGYQSAKRLL